MQLIQEIEKEEKLLLDIVTQTLKIAQSKMIAVEVYAKKIIGMSINVRNSIIENVEFNRDGTLFLTVYNKFSKGSVSSKDFTMNGIKNMLEIAINISNYSSSDFFSGLPDVKQLCLHAKNLDLFHPFECNIENIIQFVTISEKAAFKFDKRIVNSEGSFFNHRYTIHVFGNSLGMLEKYKSTHYSTYSCVIAQHKDSMQRDFDYSISRKLDELEKPEILGKNTAKRAISRLGAKKIKSTKLPIIFSSAIAHILFSHLANAISGDNVYQKSTFLIHDLNKIIFPEWLSIKENPHIKQGLGSKPFDDEGVYTRTKYIIQNGILKTWLLNTYNARKLNLQSTGNCGGIFNWIVECDYISFQELLKKMHTGILLTELMGQGVDIVTGHYSRGAIGFYVEKGIISYPVHEITISGNLRDMYNNILNISDDIDIRNNIQCGSVLLSEMHISGN